MAEICIGIGSNINPEKNIRAAIKKLRVAWPKIRFSSIYRSAPLLQADQPHFLNAVAAFTTNDLPEEILDKLQTIERDLNKSPPYRYGPRTIDLDLLLCGDAVSSTPLLTLPHPELSRRKFVLLPLLELVGFNALHPLLRVRFSDLLHAVDDQECEKVEFDAE